MDQGAVSGGPTVVLLNSWQSAGVHVTLPTVLGETPAHPPVQASDVCAGAFIAIRRVATASGKLRPMILPRRFLVSTTGRPFSRTFLVTLRPNIFMDSPW